MLYELQQKVVLSAYGEFLPHHLKCFSELHLESMLKNTNLPVVWENKLERLSLAQYFRPRPRKAFTSLTLLVGSWPYSQVIN